MAKLDDAALVGGGPKPNPRRKLFDWISNPHSENITPFQKFIIDVDWGKSPLGPMHKWPMQLRLMVLLVVQDPSPAVVYWGDDNTIVYNESYISLIGSKHPALQGHDPKVGFAEVWIHFEKLLANQRETAETVVEANAFLLFHRHGFFEETYFSWKFVPIIGDEGWVVGSHATVVEVTREVIADRRMSTVRSLSRHLAVSKSITDLWKQLLRGIESADKDVPLALLFSVASPPTAKSTVINKGLHTTAISGICTLQGSIGVPNNHKLAPSKVDLQHDEYFLVGAFRQAMDRMTLLEVSIDSTRPEFEGLDYRGHGVAPTCLVVCPIIPANSTKVLAFLVIALNPRRPFDGDYSDFLHLLTQQVTTPQLSAVILREEVERQQVLATEEALDRDRLSRQLSESETKFARFATRAPIGLAILEPNGLALSANDLWRDLTQLEVGSQMVSWEEVLAEEEVEPVIKAWEKLINEKKPHMIQTRLKKPWPAPELDSAGNIQWQETHILLAMHPDFDEDGELTTVMSCVQDISGLKWTESQLRRKMDQAIEMKKQQERFIDMTSHEMRNPLSALIGCADEIITSLNQYREFITHADASITNAPLSTTSSTPSYLVDEAIEAADTIIYCALHQKRIIDDILTLSRLDSKLLMVSPEPSCPILLVRNALKMFDAELRRADIKLDFKEENTLKHLDINWTLLDSSRVLQVLINLLTNAIKFTRTEALRNIRVTMDASLDAPSESNPMGIQYVHKNLASTDETTKPEWGTGQLVYLIITVTDTGRGLSLPEIEKLFHLFTQANPKTYQTYGGSGLGLFISRQLVEMQGGQIGVKSEAGKGSTFQFYIKTRKTDSALAPQKADFQLLARQDALREACAVDLESLESKIPALRIQPENVMPHSPAIDTEKTPSFHILVVEDNLVNQKVVTKQLRKSGNIVHVANHGQEALDFIQKSQFWSPQVAGGGEKLDVVLLDLEMPVMDGLTCVQRIRELQTKGMINGHIPVIAVTANARKDQIMYCLEAGMDDVTTKPYRMLDMLKQIETLLTKKHNSLYGFQE